MELKNDPHIFVGLQRDLDISHQPAQFLTDALNIRLTARDDRNLQAVTNERSTLKCNFYYNEEEKEIEEKEIEGKYLGHCVLGEYVVVFTCDSEKDRIYRLKKISEADDKCDFEIRILVEGNLNFDLNYPIETKTFYESDFIQKVYWVDGKNQPRFINITQPEYKNNNSTPSSFNLSSYYDINEESDEITNFNFIQNLDLNELVKVEKTSGGSFHSGVIQYAFTYYNKFGQESNIVYVTPLYYIAHKDRAGAPDDVIDTAFKITVANLDTKFDYLRIYSILRTSKDVVPTVKRVTDISLKDASNIKSKLNNVEFDTIYDWESDAEATNAVDLGIEKLDLQTSTIVPYLVVEDKEVLSDTDGSYLHNQLTISSDQNDEKYQEAYKEKYEYDSETGYTLTYGWFRYNTPSTYQLILDVYNSDDVITNLENTKYTDELGYGVDGNKIKVNLNKYPDAAFFVNGRYYKVKRSAVDDKKVSFLYADFYGTSELNSWGEFNPSNNTNSQQFTIYTKDNKMYKDPNHEIEIDRLESGNAYINLSENYKGSAETNWLKRKELEKLKSQNPEGELPTLDDIDLEYLFYEGGVYINYDSSELYDENFKITTDSQEDCIISRTTFEDLKQERTKSIYNELLESKFIDTLVTFVDTNRTGDIIDPSELLYKGGETIIPNNIEIKDNTLFLGNYSVVKQPLLEITKELEENNNTYYSLMESSRKVSSDGLNFGVLGNNVFNNLSAKHLEVSDSEEKKETFFAGSLTNPTTFKRGEYYRFGYQVQYKDGKWSEPIYLEDIQVSNDLGKIVDNNFRELPSFKVTINKEISSKLYDKGYKKIRGLVVFPALDERKIITQGVLNPTVFSAANRINNIVKAQASWFFRPFYYRSQNAFNNIFDSNLRKYGDLIQWVHFLNVNSIYSDLSPFISAEIFGSGMIESGSLFNKYANATTNVIIRNIPYREETTWGKLYNQFFIDQSIQTLNSPDINFDTAIANLDLTNVDLNVVGKIIIQNTVGDIDIQTSSAPISDNGGFNKKQIVSDKDGVRGRQLCAGLFYEDGVVCDQDDDKLSMAGSANVLFPVFPWHKSGSLNNDIIRSEKGGTRSSVLKTKKISNIRTSYTHFDRFIKDEIKPLTINLFNEDTVAIKPLLNNQYYYGNVDTAFSTIGEASVNFQGKVTKANSYGYPTKTELDFYDTNIYWWRPSSSLTFGVSNSKGFICKTVSNNQHNKMYKIGNQNEQLLGTQDNIRMKYKSTPHIVVELDKPLISFTNNSDEKGYHDALEVTLQTKNTDKNTYLCLGELVRNVDENTIFGGKTHSALEANLWIPAGEPEKINNDRSTTFEFIWGDTWVCAYDCLKTYAFTNEDENQIIDILSFIVESRFNTDGRYDRNRGKTNNLNVSPANFNLMNSVYSQLNNFFNYRMLDEDYYKITNYPNTITYSLEKQSAAEVDTFTHIPLTNSVDLPGHFGKNTAIIANENTLIAFQEKGIQEILFNNRVQIPTSDNNPIEITNGYKVSGTRTLYDNYGCNNKFAICKMPQTLFFQNSLGGSIIAIGQQQIANISFTNNLDTWFKKQDTSYWNANNWTGIKLFYDNEYSDLYIIPNRDNKALVFSNILSQFTSFMDYQDTPAMFNYNGKLYALKNIINNNNEKNVNLYKMYSGKDYNKFFEDYKPFYIEFVSQVEASESKMFTNIEFVADELESNKATEDFPNGAKTYANVFDKIYISNEYQYGEKKLNYTRLGKSNLKKKFRIWRADIPRECYEENGKFIETQNRIVNPWATIKLERTQDESNLINKKFVLHNLNVKSYMV